MPVLNEVPTIEPAAALGRSVGSGVSWFALATILTRIASFAAQLVLGWLLTKEDFGIFAIAVSLASLLSIIRDGGVRDLLVQRGAAFGSADDGPLFWIALTFNIALAAVMIGGSWFFAWYYDKAELVPMLIIMGASIPLSTLGSIYYARLRIQFRFREAAMWTTWPAIIRFGSTIAFALAGAGVYSFVWPWVLVAVAESVLGWLYVREKVWLAPPKWSRWPALLREVRWLLLGRLADVGLSHGDYLVAGKLLTVGAMGLYFFAFQLVAQSSLLLSTNLQTVLLPALARLTNEKERFANALHRAMRVQAMWSSVICFGLAAVMDPLERLLWHGQWAEAVPAMIVLTIGFPMKVTQGITTAALQAQGRFKALGIVSIVEAIGFMVSAFVGGTLAKHVVSGAGPRWLATDQQTEALVISVVVTVYVIISRMAVCAWAFKVSHARRREAGMDLFPAWVIGIAAAALAILFDKGVLLQGVAKPSWVLNLARFIVCGAIFTLGYAILTRLIVPRQLIQAVEVLPQRFNARRWARRLLLLPAD
jgi:O-antigen/teichoic acid export membrane protein